VTVRLDPSAEAVPLQLADVHGGTALGRRIDVESASGAWTASRLTDVLVGAGFDDVRIAAGRAAGPGGDAPLTATARRALSLADTVGPAMRVLICGLNPSRYAAELGVPFARPGNRFWTAAVAAGLTDAPRDARRALTVGGTGMTDLVKRATVRAGEITPPEYRAGLGRVERLVCWLRPAVVCVLGVTGWRHAVDRRATVGPIGGGLGGRPAYLMGNPSGLNAHQQVPDIVRHLRTALSLAAGTG
jgi:double-stranded uracil-DNA glycosylase